MKLFGAVTQMIKFNQDTVSEVEKFGLHFKIGSILAGTCIISGMEIGNGAVVGAGAVVTKEVPDYAIVPEIPPVFCGIVFEMYAMALCRILIC